MAVSANWLHSPSRLCHREGAFTQFTFQNGQESRKWLTIQICHVLNAWEAKKPLYGTKNLSKGAKTRVRVLADIQNFALRAHCVHGIPSEPSLRRELVLRTRHAEVKKGAERRRRLLKYVTQDINNAQNMLDITWWVKIKNFFGGSFFVPK